MPEWLGIPAAFVAWSFALYVYVVAPKTRGSLFLISMLFIDGAAVISSYDNSQVISDWLSIDIEIMHRIHQASDWLLVGVYLPFIGLTLGSPLVRPLKGQRARTVLLATGGLIALSVLILPEEARQVFNTPFYAVICIALAWGFIAALHSWIIATSEARRARARAFTLAFGVRDVLWTFTFAMSFLYGLGYIAEGGPMPWGTIVATLYALAVIIYVPLVAYGMLRTQLFDIDLRIKRTLRRSTVAAAFVAAFFLVSELAAMYLSSQLGNLLGLICTAALVFFLEPIQRAASRFSDAAMPNTQETAEYESYRKLQVYETAIQAALEEGGVSDRQRRVLDSLVTSLGIDAQVAEKLESDARAAR